LKKRNLQRGSWALSKPMSLLGAGSKRVADELQRLYNLPLLLALSFAQQEVQIWFGSSLKRQGERIRFLLLFPQSCKPHRPCPLSTPSLLL